MAAEGRRKPAQVVMSNEKREIVEDALRGSMSGLPVASNGPTVPLKQAADELASLGFADNHLSSALAALEIDGRASTAGCLQWLCLNLPPADLPPAFAPGIHFLLLQHAAYIEGRKDSCLCSSLGIAPYFC